MSIAQLVDAARRYHEATEAGESEEAQSQAHEDLIDAVHHVPWDGKVEPPDLTPEQQGRFMDIACDTTVLSLHERAMDAGLHRCKCGRYHGTEPPFCPLCQRDYDAVCKWRTDHEEWIARGGPMHYEPQPPLSTLVKHRGADEPLVFVDQVCGVHSLESTVSIMVAEAAVRDTPCGDVREPPPQPPALPVDPPGPPIDIIAEGSTKPIK